MANKDAAFGMRPVGTLSGQSNMQTNEYFIADNEASSMFQGDPVIQQASNTGFIDIGATGSETNIGVLNGVLIDNNPSTGKPSFQNFYTQTNVTSGSIRAFVYDDPYMKFEIQGDTGTNSDVTDRHEVADYVNMGTESANGVSAAELDMSDLAATDGSLKIVGFSTDPENNELGSAHMNYIVIWNEHTFKKEL
jgi:hypothetical protein|tara:strand:+ start:569 stop:1147 length:579 start_codon:yes stop_codon:yes gene_type:complete